MKLWYFDWQLCFRIAPHLPFPSLSPSVESCWEPPHFTCLEVWPFHSKNHAHQRMMLTKCVYMWGHGFFYKLPGMINIVISWCVTAQTPRTRCAYLWNATRFHIAAVLDTLAIRTYCIEDVCKDCCEHFLTLDLQNALACGFVTCSPSCVASASNPITHDRTEERRTEQNPL